MTDSILIQELRERTAFAQENPPQFGHIVDDTVWLHATHDKLRAKLVNAADTGAYSYRYEVGGVHERSPFRKVYIRRALLLAEKFRAAGFYSYVHEEERDRHIYEIYVIIEWTEPTKCPI